MTPIPMDVTISPDGSGPAHTWCDCDRIVPVDGDGRLLARAAVSPDGSYATRISRVPSGDSGDGELLGWVVCDRCRERSSKALARVARDFGIGVDIARKCLEGGRALEGYAAELRAHLRPEQDGLVPRAPVPAAFEGLLPSVGPEREAFVNRLTGELSAELRAGNTVRLVADGQTVARWTPDDYGRGRTAPAEPDSWVDVVRSEKGADGEK